MGELNIDEVLDMTEDIPVEQVKKTGKAPKYKPKSAFNNMDTDKMVNCLRNEKITVKFIPRVTGFITDKNHVLYGGLGINSKIRYVVPKLSNGLYVNVLTNSEKDYLEYIMGLEENALSIYKKVDNFWENRGVILGKGDTVLDLSNPDDYIKYKILLVNKDFVAPDEETLNKYRKATYRYVLVKEGSDYEMANSSLSINEMAYKLYGQLKNELEKLALVVELGTGRIVSTSNKDSFYTFVDKFIKDTPARFIEVASDEYLETKLLIKRCVERGVIRKRGTYYYFTEDNSPLCLEREEPTLTSACKYLNLPKYQEKKFYLEGKINEL